MTSESSSNERESKNIEDVTSATDGAQNKASATQEKAASDNNTDLSEVKAAKPVKRNQTVAPVRKTATKKTEANSDVAKKRTGPVLFVKQAIGELKQVYWPTRSQVRQYFLVVLVFVVVIMFLIAGLDWLFNWLILNALG